MHVSVLAVGAAVPTLEQLNNDSYRRATDDLRGRIAREGGGIEAYRTLVAPMDREHAARASAIAASAAALYSAAAILDAHQQGAPPSSYLTAAAQTADALDRMLRSLQRGDVLPALPIPAAVTVAAEGIRVLAFQLQTSDAGLTDH